jgi:hypothetical protein
MVEIELSSNKNILFIKSNMSPFGKITFKRVEKANEREKNVHK